MPRTSSPVTDDPQSDSIWILSSTFIIFSMQSGKTKLSQISLFVLFRHTVFLPHIYIYIYIIVKIYIFNFSVGFTKGRETDIFSFHGASSY